MLLPCSEKIFLRVLRFSTLLKNQQRQTLIRFGTHGYLQTSSYELLSTRWVNTLQPSNYNSGDLARNKTKQIPVFGRNKAPGGKNRYSGELLSGTEDRKKFGDRRHEDFAFPTQLYYRRRAVLFVKDSQLQVLKYHTRNSCNKYQKYCHHPKAIYGQKLVSVKERVSFISRKTK